MIFIPLINKHIIISNDMLIIKFKYIFYLPAIAACAAASLAIGTRNGEHDT